MKVKELNAFLNSVDTLGDKSLFVFLRSQFNSTFNSKIVDFETNEKNFYIDAHESKGRKGQKVVGEFAELLTLPENQEKQVIISVTGVTGQYEEIVPTFDLVTNDNKDFNLEVKY